MNKPTNEADAFNMLKKLSGKWHKVHMAGCDNLCCQC
jgi:predicted house-cleaning NTP pyrophosphatase (Maf/HAM1 superfamily)